MSFSIPKFTPPSAPPAWLGMDADAFKAAIAAAPDRNPAAGPPPIRATRKAAQWGAAIHRAWAYLAVRASDPAHEAGLAARLEQTLKDGPDFAKVRRNATFAPVPIVAYSRQAAAEIMRQAREIERETYAARAKGGHGGALGRMALQLLEWFCFVMWPKARFGMVPSLAHIAADARMSRATVVEAMKRLETFGFLTIQRRRKRVETPLGSKVVQDTNAYVLSLARRLAALAGFAKKPAAVADKQAGPSEFRSRRAIKTEHYIPMAQGAHAYPKPDYEPLLE